MRINNNIMAMNTHRQFAINNSNVAKATEKLSSGYRVNRAGDDAAGLAISEKMRAQIKGLSMASKNSQDAISLVQTAEGALTETHSILQRMRELSVQSASDTNEGTVDRVALDAEFQQLKSEIDDIAGKTKFNDMTLLDGNFGTTNAVDTACELQVGLVGITSIKLEGFAAGANVITLGGGGGGADFTATHDVSGVTVTGLANSADGTAQTWSMDFGNGMKATIEFGESWLQDGVAATETLTFTATVNGGTIQTGANSGDSLNITIGAMDATTLAVNTNDITDRTNADASITAVNAAINTVSSQRATLGAMQNRLQHKINNLDTSAENLQAAESRIRDLDMAAEMTEFTKNNILVQAATSMLAQANAAPQGVLQLLQ